MLRMIDLIRESAVPANLMQSASKGALALPAQEMIEILVYLATENSVFGETARLTLAGWDEASSKEAARNPGTAKEVLDYLVSVDNLRPALLPSLMENPSIQEEALVKLAADGSRAIVQVMAESKRAGESRPILRALTLNANLPAGVANALKTKLTALNDDAGEGSDIGDVFDEETTAYLAQHSAELAAEGEKPFEPIGGLTDGLHIEADEPLAEVVPASTSASTAPAGSGQAAAPKKAPVPVQVQRGSALQKISNLDVRGRIQLALKGNKEERSILIRDGTKLVSLAVLDSPKITDGEVERFASQKNVLEAVLRGIPMKRRFYKNYIIVRNLVFNPRTPLDVTLGLMKNLLTHDLRNLSGNKDVSDTIRKLALKMFKEKLSQGNKKE